MYCLSKLQSKCLLILNIQARVSFQILHLGTAIYLEKLLIKVFTTGLPSLYSPRQIAMIELINLPLAMVVQDLVLDENVSSV